nr:enoyl-coa delta isomerase 3 [Quercus suber]
MRLVTLKYVLLEDMILPGVLPRWVTPARSCKAILSRYISASVDGQEISSLELDSFQPWPGHQLPDNVSSTPPVEVNFDARASNTSSGVADVYRKEGKGKERRVVGLEVVSPVSGGSPGERGRGYVPSDLEDDPLHAIAREASYLAVFYGLSSLFCIPIVDRSSSCPSQEECSSSFQLRLPKAKSSAPNRHRRTSVKHCCWHSTSSRLGSSPVWSSPLPASRSFWKDSLYPLWRRIITYPGPTVALINGHAFAGALMVAMMHDYRIMNPHKGFLCLNEVDLGAPLRPPMMSVFRQKVSAQTFRRLVLEGARFKALDALKEGIVDSLGGLDDTLKYIEELKLVGKAQPGMSGMAVYRQLKQEMWRETISYLENFDAEPAYLDQRGQQTDEELALSAKKAEEWSKTSGNGKAKL